MGLSSKQVSRDVGAGGGTELGWTQSFLESGALEFSKKNHTQVIQQQQQKQQLLLQRSQMAPLKCPRCDSMNTKFCYYNNYNQSQPRHFCKTCKRHWTKGGMLRNVPVGGGRKNKRLKTINTNNNKSTSKRVNVTNRQLQHQQKQQQQHIINDCHDLGHVAVLEPMRETWREGIQMNQHQKNMSEVLNQAFISPTTLDFVNNQNSFLVASEDDDLSSSPVPNFNFTGLTSTLENHPSSMSSSSSFAGGFQSSNVFNFIGEETSDEDLTNPATITTASILLPPPTTPWQAPNTNSILDSTTMTPPVNWSWEDLNTLISTDLNQPWDDDGNQDK